MTHGERTAYGQGYYAAEKRYTKNERTKNIGIVDDLLRVLSLALHVIKEKTDTKGETMKCFKVNVATTDTLRKNTYGSGRGEIGINKAPFRDCEHGFLYVVTDDPKKIYDEFPATIGIEEIGVGYCINKGA